MTDNMERKPCVEVLENRERCPALAMEGSNFCSAHGLIAIGNQWIEAVSAVRRLAQRFPAERKDVVCALLDHWKSALYPATREECEQQRAAGSSAISPEALRYCDSLTTLTAAERGLLEVYRAASITGVEIHELVGWDESSPRGLEDGSIDLTHLAFNYPEDLAHRCADYAKGALRPNSGFVLPTDALEHETKRILQRLSHLRGLTELVSDVAASPRDTGWRLDMHTVFRAEEFGEFLIKRGSRNVRTRDSLLTYYVSSGRLLRVRRGLYAVVPPGQTLETMQPDPFLLAARMTPDAVLAYHTALEFYGRAYSSFHEFTYLTNIATQPAEFRGNTFRGATYPKSLLAKDQKNFGVKAAERSGLDVRVTSLERTLVDVLDRPAISGSWEEIWRSLESVEYYDLDIVSEYVLMLGNATTVAKVGFYLEQHAEQLMVERSVLSRLRLHIPKKPHYLDRSTHEPAHLVGPWNLMVPERILNRSWEESG